MGMTDYIVVENMILHCIFLFDNQECAKISLRQKAFTDFILLSAKICLR